MGIETTTGPLGQGFANAVGLALAEKLLAVEYNKDGLALVDHHTYCFAGDGCLMEGISHEAASLAGTLKLGKLIVFYDDNGISIDGKVIGWFTDDTPKRFEAYGWHVVKNVDGHDADAVAAAIKKAKSKKDQPTLICCKTIIGWGAPEQAGHQVRARRGARRRGSGQRAQAAGLGLSAVRHSRRHPHRLGCTRSRRRRGEEVDPPVEALQARIRGGSGAVRTPHEGRPAGQLGRDLAGSAGGRRRGECAAGHARVLAGGAQRARPLSTGAAGRLGGPDRFGQHAPQGFHRPDLRSVPRATTCTTACASSA